MTLRSYDASAVSMFYGVIEMQGFAEDSAIEAENDADDWSLKVGVDGEPTRSKTSIKSATVTVSLEQSSAVNDLLAAERLLDINAPGGTGGKPLIIKDNSGRTVLSAEAAWIQKPPTGTFNRESSTREWIFRAGEFDRFDGGNL